MTNDLHVVLGAGPVGRAVTNQLTDQGRSVRVVTRSGSTPTPSGVDSVAADIADPAAAQRACAGAAVVYGCVGLDYKGWPEVWPPMMAGIAAAIDTLNGYLDQVEAETGIPAAQTALVGFSQGTMMSLHVGPRRPAPYAGIVGFSGRLMSPETLEAEAVSKPPILLVHGDQDQMIPVSDMSTAETALRGAGFDVASHISRGVGHGIAPDGLALALQFMMQHLGINPDA